MHGYEAVIFSGFFFGIIGLLSMVFVLSGRRPQFVGFTNGAKQRTLKAIAAGKSVHPDKQVALDQEAIARKALNRQRRLKRASLSKRLPNGRMKSSNALQCMRSTA
jgi:hypothetical protein